MKKLVLVALCCSTAVAQSKRYPPQPIDKDEEAASKSKLWEAASNPRRSPYNDLVREAEELLRDKSREAASEAIAKLDAAVKLMPEEEPAYRLRGDAAMLLDDWGRCADDYARALARRRRGERADADLKAATDLRRRGGLCLARAGKLAEAERTLADAAAGGAATGEVWMRLGEVRVVLGKLDEAISAFEAAKELGDVSQPLVRWLLAGAYDRARRPAEAVAAGQEAFKGDRELSTLQSSVVPLLGTGETEYLMGLGYSVQDPPQPEHALVYYRRFQKVAPTSPWKKRADDHIRELRAIALPEYVSKLRGNALMEPLVARAAVRRLMPAMRACLAKHPDVLFSIAVIKNGPRTQTRSRMPPEGVTILPKLNPGDVSKIELDAITRCLEPQGEKARIAMPAIKDRDAYYVAEFFVVAP